MARAMTAMRGRARRRCRRRKVPTLARTIHLLFARGGGGEAAHVSARALACESPGWVNWRRCAGDFPLVLLGRGPGGADGPLSRRQPCRLHSERRARHVVQADLVAKYHRRGVAAVLAADPDVQVWEIGRAHV